MCFEHCRERFTGVLTALIRIENLWHAVAFQGFFQGVGVWQFERYLDERERQRQWREADERLRLEYEGRLSQYSEWFLMQLTSPDRPMEYTFKPCVTPGYLRWTIKVLSGKPNYKNVNLRQEADNCTGYPSFQAIFDEYSEKSTLGVFMELRLTSEKLFSESWEIDLEDRSIVPDKNADAHRFRTRLLEAVNDFLNPDAVVPLRVNSMKNFSVNDYRKAFMHLFYGIGPGELWYGDVFAG